MSWFQRKEYDWSLRYMASSCYQTWYQHPKYENTCWFIMAATVGNICTDGGLKGNQILLFLWWYQIFAIWGCLFEQKISYALSKNMPIMNPMSVYDQFRYVIIIKNLVIRVRIIIIVHIIYLLDSTVNLFYLYTIEQSNLLLLALIFSSLSDYDYRWYYP